MFLKRGVGPSFRYCFCLGSKIPRAYYVDVTSKNTFSVPSTDWSTSEPGFATEIAVKSKHKKYDEIIKNHPGPFKPSFFVFAIETTGAWAKENLAFFEHLKAAAQLKLQDFADIFVTTMTRKIVLNHRKNVVQGILDFLGRHSSPFQPEQTMSAHDLEWVSRVLEA